MSDEKRLYRRIKVGAKSLVYDGNNEYEGTLKDISENGVSIVVTIYFILFSILKTAKYLKGQILWN